MIHYTCPCLPRPHESNVILLGGKPCCTWCLKPAIAVSDDEAEEDGEPVEAILPGLTL